MIGNQALLFHLMLKQGFNWFSLTQKDQEVDEVYTDLELKLYFSEKWPERSAPFATLSLDQYVQDYQWTQ